eukprot:403347943
MELKNSFAIIEILQFLDYKDQLKLQDINRKFYEVFVPRLTLEVPIFCPRSSVFIMFPNNSLFELNQERALLGRLINPDINVSSSESVEEKDKQQQMKIVDKNINNYWKKIPFRKTNFDKDIMTIWQKVIQVNDWHVYIISGINKNVQSRATKQCYCFDIRYRTLTRVANIIQKRSGFGLCHIKEKIYVCAGSRVTYNRRIRSCEVFDTIKNQWSPFIDLPEDIVSPVATQFEDRLIYLVGGFSRQDEGEHLTRLFRIDTNQNTPEWETIQVSSKEPVPSLCQLGLFNLSNNNPEQHNTGNHEFIIFGGLDLDSNYDTSAYYCKLQNESQGIQQINKEGNNSMMDQSSGNEQSKVEIVKLNSKLTIGDRLYYNQWLQLENKRDCKQWFIMGRTAGHYVNFDTQDLSMTSFSSNMELAYQQLLEKY